MTKGEGLKRAKRAWYPLLFVLLFLWLDWITHRSFVFVIVGGAIAVGVIVFPKQIQAKLPPDLAKRFNLTDPLAQVPPKIKPFVAASPGLLYFMLRGKGTSGAGLTVPVVSLLAGACVRAYGEQIDKRLAGFYRVRDVVPRVVRMVLVPVLSIVLAFLIIHGNVGDMGALIGKATTQPRSPAGLQGRFILATLATMTVSILLLRRSSKERVS